MARILISGELAAGLGTRRTARLKRIIQHTGLPPEAVIDLALEMMEIASRTLSPSPIFGVRAEVSSRSAREHAAETSVPQGVVSPFQRRRERPETEPL